MAHVVLKSVDKSFGKVDVIRNVNLEIEDGEFVVFVGPSGCGKSTLLRLIAGLEDLSAGDIYIDDARVDHLAPAKRGVAMVFQSYALYPHFTVRQNMGYALKVARESKTEIARKVEAAADVLQLTEYLDRKPKALSGGQRQRVAIGRAIVRDPKVFLFDEPLSNLDAKLRVQMRIELTKLHAKLGATMIYVTHDQVEAMTMADKIVVLRDGVVEQVGAPLELYRRPDNLFVAGFIGSPAMNMFEGTVVQASETALELDLSDIGRLSWPLPGPARLKAGDRVHFGIRPEHFTREGDHTATVNGTVYAAERLGGETYIYLNTESGREMVVHASGDWPAHPGESTRAGFMLSDAHLFDPDGQRVARADEHEGG